MAGGIANAAHFAWQITTPVPNMPACSKVWHINSMPHNFGSAPSKTARWQQTCPSGLDIELQAFSAAATFFKPAITARVRISSFCAWSFARSASLRFCCSTFFSVVLVMFSLRVFTVCIFSFRSAALRRIAACMAVCWSMSGLQRCASARGTVPPCSGHPMARSWLRS